MATTHIHNNAPARETRRIERTEESSGYAAVWAILAIALLAAIAYGFYANDDDADLTINSTQPYVQTDTVPVTDGTASTTITLPDNTTTTTNEFSTTPADSTTVEGSVTTTDTVQ